MDEAAFPGPPSCSGETICTHFDRDFHYGLAAMLNSLVQAGYKGTVWAGYRGALHQVKLKRMAGRGDLYRVTDQKSGLRSARERFIWRFTSAVQAGPAGEPRPRVRVHLVFRFGYLPAPQVVLLVNWRLIAVCQDILHHVLPEHDPLRQEWAEIAAGMGLG